jgi:hypothetical protein
MPIVACSGSNLPLGSLSFGEYRRESCELTAATPSKFRHDVVVANPRGADFGVYAADGFDCTTVMNNFYPAPFSVPSTTANSTSIVGAPCALSPCCSVVVCNREPCAGLVVSYSFYEPDAGLSTTVIIGISAGVLLFCVLLCCALRAWTQRRALQKALLGQGLRAPQEVVYVMPQAMPAAQTQQPLLVPQGYYAAAQGLPAGQQYYGTEQAQGGFYAPQPPQPYFVQQSGPSGYYNPQQPPSPQYFNSTGV